MVLLKAFHKNNLANVKYMVPGLLILVECTRFNVLVYTNAGTYLYLFVFLSNALSKISLTTAKTINMRVEHRIQYFAFNIYIHTGVCLVRGASLTFNISTTVLGNNK